MMAMAQKYFWRGLFAVIMAAGLYATFLRFWGGLGASTNLSDQFPWGIWIGFDVLCGVGLALFGLVGLAERLVLQRYGPNAGR